MNPPFRHLACRLLIGVTLALACLAATGQAQVKKKNPASKVFVSDVSGEAEIDTGDSVEDLSKRSVYTAQGSVIDTKRPKNNEDRSKYYSTMVYSNGTGAFFDADTRVEIRRFIQEPFVPTRTDNEVEPSISQTHAHVARGVVGLCASKLVAGSTMTYTTPHAAVNIHGRKLVIDVRPDQTRIAVLEGESTVRAGSMDMGGHTIRAGQEAIIRPGAPGQPNQIEIIKIPPAEAGGFDDKVSMACMAKRTVYFEVRGRQQNQGSSDGTIDAFNSEINTPRVPGGPFVGADGEIIAIPIVPPNLPVQHTVSPSSLITPTGQVVTPGNPKG
ncbi:hypothetical protein [Opitutus sp. ER46]|uniref:hypothetical protein n=1 Tax=Opitutus sp. ER46 TaxID=2161864 RepID=UPI000D3044D4|nr:hypothetical protein [Opitutus sp. ER46]PTX94532.1 hypothetical protein DB354_12405 [Opitutus sp. ER46]